jgi:acetoin utilization deacetylase AcuC-like enzyme
LEGGYSLDYIGNCFISQVGQLAGYPQKFKDSTDEHDTSKQVYTQLKKKLDPFWKL